MKALVLCGGYGTRLGSLTKATPKPMLPLEGKPLLEYTLQYLAHHGIREVAINLHFEAEQIKTHFGDGSNFGVQLTYSFEPTLLGTAGAVKKLEPFFQEEQDFFVIYGDLLLQEDLSAMMHFHRERQAYATLLLHRRNKSNSIVHMNDEQQITSFLERPSEAQQKQQTTEFWVNSGVYLLSSNILSEIPAATEVDFPRQIFPAMLEKHTMLGYPLSSYRCAIDSPARLQEAERAIREGDYRLPKTD